MLLRLKQLREARKLTVEQLAERAGMSKSYLSEIENGKKQINARRLEGLALALGVAATDLIADRSVGDVIADHLDVVRQLDPEDQAAVQRHALSLLRAKSPE